ncbi:hypothetical protein THARTR1_08103 [Trichoderma harzianum]|uniref:Uncharacterized protein n=1 Tax=Trichoderma harzianum TaxID=5544 RepID=A0A2K0U082_TRIHA|nr:hypothetical protein THARTR1_08103 [Trichoderma harzianum]
MDGVYFRDTKSFPNVPIEEIPMNPNPEGLGSDSLVASNPISNFNDTFHTDTSSSEFSLLVYKVTLYKLI